MPLLDNFRPPLSGRRHWSAFHNAWATFLAADLNRRLPERYFAEANVRFSIEIDVATYAEEGAGGASTFQPGAATQTLNFPIVGEVAEVLVYSTREGPVLAGAIELVSPANKDRPEHREAFVSKCESYLQEVVGVVIVDVVTERSANLHNELITRYDPTASQCNADLYATAYRVVKDGAEARLQIWQETLSLGQALPTMPLWLRGGLCLPVELDQAYRRTCEEYRITVNGH